MHKSGVKRLTIHSVLFRLCSRLAVLRRWGGRTFSGEVAIPEMGNGRRLDWMIRSLGAMRRSERTRCAVWGVAAFAVGLAGCASVGGVNRDSSADAKKAVVTERIYARWQALIKGDLETAYTYLSAASQEAMPLKVYEIKVKPGMWRSVKIDSLQCEAETCKAKMTLTYDHARMKGIQTPFEEDWIIDKGTAWYVYRAE